VREKLLRLFTIGVLRTPIAVLVQQRRVRGEGG